MEGLSAALEQLQTAKLETSSLITYFVPLMDSLFRIIATSPVNVHKLQVLPTPL